MPLSFDRLKRDLQAGLDRLPSYNYGWWLITRQHQDVARITTFCQFIYSLVGSDWISLTDKQYDELQVALGSTVPEGGARQVLNRHFLLNLWRPLRLIDRETEHSINPFALTSVGVELIQGVPRSVLETILTRIKFVDPEWCRSQVVADYAGISLCPYIVLKKILEHCDERLSRDEYRLFVARLTNERESTVTSAVKCILTFRELRSDQQEQLKAIERSIFSTRAKAYQNWVDMDLHTFSLFALGTTFRRIETTLVLAGTDAAASVSGKRMIATRRRRRRIAVRTAPRERAAIELRLPEPNDALDEIEPPSIAVNTGTEAEVYVADAFAENGFETRIVSRIRGYGFDIYAKNKETGVALYIEVKSALDRLSSIQLTDLEFKAARKYRGRYVLACVEHFDASEHTGELWIVQDPWRGIPALRSRRTTVVRRASRSQWQHRAVRWGES